MKTLLASLFIAFSVSAMAQTYSEETASQMQDVLKSETVQNLLKQEDGVGNLKGITYLYSGRASFGPAIFELAFVSHSMQGPQLCKVNVSLDLLTKETSASLGLECSPLVQH
jgi:hypothetical protein